MSESVPKFALLKFPAPASSPAPTKPPAKHALVAAAKRLEARSPRAAAVIESLIYDVLADLEGRRN